jgi:pre-rRNA-processing protein IPI1
VQKAKLKLGKGKTLPSNAVDTSFKARCKTILLYARLILILTNVAIALPTQSITVEKDSSEPLTRRHLAFDDLISHLKHHNAGARRGEPFDKICLNYLIFVQDAILGLKELLDSNPELIIPHLTSLLSALVRLIGDEVRFCSNVFCVH